ncbi:HEAT repeat domain-containing protein [Granulicella sp. dw_53]|uniref:HEAT repeat domain-containing protein n=1 Tax=Granulicella sp. dw_53 TaxID=2719792 RepID=UPI001BD225C0|nr:HEAT repeat domain-containing protein [Granulicella sp. dw_53]
MSKYSTPFRTTRINSLLPVLVTCLLLAQITLPASALAQTPASTQIPNPPAKDPDGQIVTSGSSATPSATSDDVPAPPHNPDATPAQKADEAWSILNSAATDPKHPDLRIQALAALGTMGTDPRSTKRISAAMDDKELDVRTAAILAAGETKNRNLTTDIRTMLDDKEPQVAFAAAVTLWKMNDRSGEDILLAVVEGDRSANPTLVNGARHSMSRSLRHPTDIARLGALQGASMLLGPFGFGITAYEYMRKNGGDTSRVTAIEQVSQEKTGPIRQELIAALGDKDLAVRAAAAKALGTYHDRTVGDDLFNLFIDPKPPVRFTAAAAYLNSMQAGPPSRKASPTATKRN